MLQTEEVRDFVRTEVRTLKFIVRHSQPITTSLGISTQTKQSKQTDVKAEVLQKRSELLAAIQAKAAVASARASYLAAQYPEVHEYVDRG